MHISYTGVITPYVYNCPRAHYLRNIQKVRVEVSETTLEDNEVSKRELGIQYHEQLSKFLKKEIDEFPFLTSTIDWYRSKPFLEVEKQLFFDPTFSPIKEKTKEHFISITPDAFSYYDGCLEVVDWKFANPDFNSNKYYREVEFFLSGLISIFDVAEAHVDIHFPEVDYTLPRRSYSAAALASIQHHNILLIDRIMNDRLWTPYPSKNRCMFCIGRSSETGGSGQCEDSLA